ncbi:MAG TPA: hypothetical protein VKD69_21200, partial [Vicinamibacterales bacterium]|nr:hypothetical protein [Vicinamibacterales bacterium]
MRLLTIGVLSITIVAGCKGADATTSTRNNLVTPARTAAQDQAGNPVATAGRAEAAAPAVPNAGPDGATAATGVHEVTIPAGTTLPVVLDTSVGSDTSRVEQPVTAHLTRPLTFHGETVVPAGSQVNGVVTSAERSGRVKGRAHVAVRFDSLAPNGDRERYTIRT